MRRGACVRLSRLQHAAADQTRRRATGLRRNQRIFYAYRKLNPCARRDEGELDQEETQGTFVARKSTGRPSSSAASTCVPLDQQWTPDPVPRLAPERQPSRPLRERSAATALLKRARRSARDLRRFGKRGIREHDFGAIGLEAFSAPGSSWSASGASPFALEWLHNWNCRMICSGSSPRELVTRPGIS